jgi:hypothetical protein
MEAFPPRARRQPMSVGVARFSLSHSPCCQIDFRFTLSICLAFSSAFLVAIAAVKMVGGRTGILTPLREGFMGDPVDSAEKNGVALRCFGFEVTK